MPHSSLCSLLTALLVVAFFFPRSTDYKKVPIAKIDNDVVWKGSDEIIKGLLQQDAIVSLLERRWANSSAGPNNTKATMTVQDFVGGKIADLGEGDGNKSTEVQQWLRFANDELASLLYPNICRTWSDAYRAFSYVDKIDAFSTIQKMSIQLLGSVAMHFAASRVKSEYICIIHCRFVSLFIGSWLMLSHSGFICRKAQHYR
jgi:hypothetical protein